MKAWLCLGSNLGNPEEQLQRAVDLLQEKCYIKLLRKGTVTITKPFGYKDQPDFANQLVEIETPMSPLELLAFLKHAEMQLGRKRTFKWGPRLIDLDIVFCEDDVIHTEKLDIPHPGIPERLYLLDMLNDVIPDYIHPESKISISEMHDKLIKNGGTG